MIETKKMELGGKEYTLRCSLLTAEAFERLTGKKFTKAITMYQKVGKGLSDLSDEEATDKLMSDLLDIELNALNLAYCMIEEAKHKGYNQDFDMSAEDFIGEVGALGSNELKGVLALAMSIFPRSLSKRSE